jgi:hypothetical protein
MFECFPSGGRRESDDSLGQHLCLGQRFDWESVLAIIFCCCWMSVGGTDYKFDLTIRKD